MVSGTCNHEVKQPCFQGPFSTSRKCFLEESKDPGNEVGGRVRHLVHADDFALTSKAFISTE